MCCGTMQQTAAEAIVRILYAVRHEFQTCAVFVRVLTKSLPHTLTIIRLRTGNPVLVHSRYTSCFRRRQYDRETDGSELNGDEIWHTMPFPGRSERPARVGAVKEQTLAGQSKRQAEKALAELSHIHAQLISFSMCEKVFPGNFTFLVSSHAA